MTTPTPERDRFDDLAAEALPCRYGPQLPISSRPQLCFDNNHMGPSCPAWWRNGVAAALRSTDATARREGYEAGVEDAATAVANHIITKKDGSLPWGDREVGLATVKGQYLRAIRALLNPSTEAEEGSDG